MKLGPEELSRIARRGSGSAARSIFGGFVELFAGDGDETSFAQQLAPASHWEMIDLVVLVDENIKHTGSSHGHSLAPSSPLQQGRVADTPRRLERCRSAIAARDFSALATIVEQDSDMMHGVMMTSEPSLHFWNSGTVEVMALVRKLRKEGVAVCYTIDAGPNVHCLCLPESENKLLDSLHNLPWKVLRAQPGEAARLV